MTTHDDLHAAREQLMKELSKQLPFPVAVEIVHAIEKFIDAKIGMRFSPYRNDPAP